MADTVESVPQYRAPRMLNLGDAARLTRGNGDVHVDYLGDTNTKYGQWGNTFEIDPAQPGR